MREVLRYTELPAAIKLALEQGMSNRQIVRLLTGSTSHADALKIARRAAPLLDLTIAEFMSLRKNT